MEGTVGVKIVELSGEGARKTSSNRIVMGSKQSEQPQERDQDLRLRPGDRR